MKTCRLIPRSDDEAVRTLVGMLQSAKRQIGPALGICRRHWPKAETLHRALADLYDRAKWIQDEVGKL